MINDTTASMTVAFVQANPLQQAYTQVYGNGAQTFTSQPHFMSPLHLKVIGIDVGSDGALFRLVNNSSFTLSFENMVSGLDVHATDGLVTLVYQLSPHSDVPEQRPTDILRKLVENRVIALAASPMTAALIEPLRRVAAGEPATGEPNPGTSLTPVLFKSMLTMTGVEPRTRGGFLHIHGYQLHANRDLTLTFSTAQQGSDTQTKTASVYDWRKEMTGWDIRRAPEHDQSILLSIIKPRGVPTDSPNSINPRNTQGQYRPRTGPATQAPSADDFTADTPASDVVKIEPTLVFTGQGVRGQNFHKEPVFGYTIVKDGEGQPTNVQFYQDEHTMIAESKLSHLVLCKYGRNSGVVVIQKQGSAASKERRETLIKHLLKNGGDDLAGALIDIDKQ